MEHKPWSARTCSRVHRRAFAGPDPAATQWLYCDQRFALATCWAPTHLRLTHCHKLSRAPGDVEPDKIGQLGSSSARIPGLAVATQGPRPPSSRSSALARTSVVRHLAAKRLVESQTSSLWPGGKPCSANTTQSCTPTSCSHTRTDGKRRRDKVVDRGARVCRAARPSYKSIERLRLVVYEGFGHNLPSDVVRLPRHWFHLT